jgi:hypothetical protein
MLVTHAESRGVGSDLSVQPIPSSPVLAALIDEAEKAKAASQRPSPAPRPVSDRGVSRLYSLD